MICWLFREVNEDNVLIRNILGEFEDSLKYVSIVEIRLTALFTAIPRPGPFLISCNGLWLTFLSKLFTFLNGRECTSRTLCIVCTTGRSLNGWLGTVYELLTMFWLEIGQYSLQSSIVELDGNLWTAPTFPIHFCTYHSVHWKPHKPICTVTLHSTHKFQKHTQNISQTCCELFGLNGAGN